MHKAHPSNDNGTGVFARVAEALESPRFITFYLGFYAGCFATVGLALLWSRVAS